MIPQKNLDHLYFRLLHDMMSTTPPTAKKAVYGVLYNIYYVHIYEGVGGCWRYVYEGVGGIYEGVGGIYIYMKGSEVYIYILYTFCSIHTSNPFMTFLLVKLSAQELWFTMDHEGLRKGPY